MRIAKFHDCQSADWPAARIGCITGIDEVWRHILRLNPVSGTDRLTTLEFTVPWTTADRDGKKLLASNAFANTVAAQLDGEVATAA